MGWTGSSGTPITSTGTDKFRTDCGSRYGTEEGSSSRRRALATASGGTITVAAEDLALGGTNLAGLTAASSIGSVAQATAYVAVVNTAITKTNSSLGQLGTGATALQNQLTFVQNLQDTLDTGIGNLVNANLGKESAQLTALQTKQQLGIQALSIANQSSSVLLSLFR